MTAGVCLPGCTAHFFRKGDDLESAHSIPQDSGSLSAHTDLLMVPVMFLAWAIVVLCVFFFQSLSFVTGHTGFLFGDSSITFVLNKLILTKR